MNHVSRPVFAPALCSLFLTACNSTPERANPAKETANVDQSPIIQMQLPSTHRGSWAGSNHLWITDPANPFQSDGSLEISERVISYSWSHEGRSHSGTLDLKGQPAAMTATWSDSFHATDPFILHGFFDSNLVRLFTTYNAGDATWGWQVELDFRDPEACTLRMFNVVPGLGPVPAVSLQGVR